MPRRATLITAAIAMAPLAMAGVGPGLAHADPHQTCTAPVWVTDMGIPIGSRTTCFNPDGSYQVCTSLGTAGPEDTRDWLNRTKKQQGGG
jgi:hypothetical protein